MLIKTQLIMVVKAVTALDNGSDSGDSIINDCRRFCKFQFAA